MAKLVEIYLAPPGHIPPRILGDTAFPARPKHMRAIRLKDDVTWRARNADTLAEVRAKPFVMRSRRVRGTILDDIVASVVTTADARSICCSQAARIAPDDPKRH